MERANKKSTIFAFSSCEIFLPLYSTVLTHCQTLNCSNGIALIGHLVFVGSKEQFPTKCF
jgi:hypothetical protein